MAIRARIRQLNFKEIFILLKLFLPKPFYSFLVYQATRKTLKVCDYLFGKKHYQDNRENTFRHAFWNFLIAQAIFQRNKSVEDALKWAEKITNLHEKIAPNKKLARLMDLHNNEIGRELFRVYYQISEQEIIKKLQELMKSAVKISEAIPITPNSNKLVYIKN